MDFEDLERLETKISGLIEKHQKMKLEKEALEKLLKEKETEFHQLMGRIRQYEEEHGDIKIRLEKILERFEGLDLQ